MNWQQKIEAQIASIPSMILELENEGHFAMAEQLRRVKRGYRKTLDVAVAADDYMTYGPLNAEFGGDIAHNRLSHALDKLREVGQDE